VASIKERLQEVESRLDALEAALGGDAAKVDAIRLKLQQARVPLAAAVASETKAPTKSKWGRTMGGTTPPTENPLDVALDALTADVAGETTVDASATTLINGIPGIVAAAVAAATAAGATPAELARLAALEATLQANVAPLQAAITANTPSAPAAS
jgi:hypothetical protein